MIMIALEAKDLTKKYRRKTAVNAVTISLEKHKIYGLLGRNGAGKRHYYIFFLDKSFQMVEVYPYLVKMFLKIGKRCKVFVL